MGNFFWPILVLLGFLAVALLVFLVNQHMERKRTEAFRGLAGELGFAFQAGGNGQLMNELSSFHLFSIGHSRQMSNLLQGQAHGLEISIFDYRYVVGSGKHRQTWVQSVFVARVPGLDLPAFSMRPESIWHKIGSWLGYEDIDFDSHPRFSKAYLLKGPDEQCIRDLFAPHVLEYFEVHKGLNVEGGGDLLLYYRYTRLDPKKIRDFMAEGFEVLKVFQADSI